MKPSIRQIRHELWAGGIAMLILTAPLWAEDAANLIPNPGFEQDAMFSPLVDTWKAMVGRGVNLPRVGKGMPLHGMLNFPDPDKPGKYRIRRWPWEETIRLPAYLALDEGLGGWKDWTYRLEYPGNESHGGRRAIGMVSPEEPSVIHFAPEIVVKPGHAYRYSLFARGKGNIEWLCFPNGGGKPVEMGPLIKVDDEENWRNFDGRWTSNLEKICVGWRIQGQVWVDDVSLAEDIGGISAVSAQEGGAGGGKTEAIEELLPNGIKISSPLAWEHAPRGWCFPAMQCSYLRSPPKVIPIDVGRQLLVDDFLVQATNLKRTFHAAEPYASNPVLRPDRPWEKKMRDGSEGQGCAMVFSDGVWYDPQDRLFKMWYMGGLISHTCYATSRDGINWEKPVLDVVPDSNIVQWNASPPEAEGTNVGFFRDSSSVCLDLYEKDPQRRYKMATSTYDRRYESTWYNSFQFYYSDDGIHWKREGRSGPMADRSTFHYNPFRKVWVYALKAVMSGIDYHFHGRCVRYWESKEWGSRGANWSSDEPLLWMGADDLDGPDDGTKMNPWAQIYGMDAVAYESVMVGLFNVWSSGARGPNMPKVNEVYTGFSRDGFQWDRPHRKPLISMSATLGTWDEGNIQSAGGVCLVVGDKLYFYYSGRKGGWGTNHVCSTGLATLRRDGFASMDAGETEGILTTRPVTFKGKHLFINLATPNGELRVEILDKDGKVIPPYTRENCAPITADKTLFKVRWKDAPDLTKLAGQPVRLRFIMKKGSLYSFWVSPDESGASHGYVAAGGPGFTGPTDTVGSGAYPEGR